MRDSEDASGGTTKLSRYSQERKREMGISSESEVVMFDGQCSSPVEQKQCGDTTRVLPEVEWIFDSG